MTLRKELQINITVDDYAERSGSYSAVYDYILLDNLASSPYFNLFRSDLRNLKIKTSHNTECKVLYIPAYSSQTSAILVEIPVSVISKTTKLILDVYDISTVFNNTLNTGGEVLMFDANTDEYSNFFMNYSGLSQNYDSSDGGKFLRSKFIPSPDGSHPTSLFTTFASGSDLANNRVTIARFKRIGGNVFVNDNGIYHESYNGCVMIQSDFNLTLYGVDRQMTAISFGGETKNYCMFDDEATLVQTVSFDAYNSGSDDEGNFIQCHIHGRVANGFSASADYIESFLKNNPSKLYDQKFHEIEIATSGYADSSMEETNYIDLKWLLVFPSPIFGSNTIPKIEVVENTKTGIRLYKGSNEYFKAYRGSVLLWDANDENLSDTGLHIPEKIISKNWDWVF